MKFQKILKKILALGLLAVLLLTAGCATKGNPDPYEKYNRKVFKFNMGVDKFVYRPIAVAYDTVTPKVAQHGVSNFFSNIDLVPSIANDILQFNFPWAFADTGRLIVNSTLGLGGLLDPATKFGMHKHTQDFGLTLAKWGVKDSPYFMLPFLPPATVRDFVGQGLDLSVLSVWAYVRPVWITYAAFGLDFTNRRASYLSTDKLLKEAFDPYLFMRDAYLQQRKGQVQQILNPQSKPEDLQSDVFGESNEDHFSDANADSSNTDLTHSEKEAKTPAPTKG